MKVYLPVTRIEEVEISDSLIRDGVRLMIGKRFPQYNQRGYIDSDGYLKTPSSYDGYSYEYSKEKATLEHIAFYNFLSQVESLFEN